MTKIATLARVFTAAVILAPLFAAPALADSDQPTDQPGQVARISIMQGDVALKRGDSGDTVAASVNAPVNVGDYLSTTGGDSRAEVQLDANNYLRVGSNAQLRFAQLDQSQETVQVAAGTVELRVLKQDVDPQIDTPSISIRADSAGQYRVTVDASGNTVFTTRSGSADLLVPNGAQAIASGESVVVSGTSADPQVRSIATVAYDDFDSWNAQRDQYVTRVFDDQYVSQDMVGADDLTGYGHWVLVADYGDVWVPYNVGPAWAPYHDGRWVWEPYYGWTWVAYEPWGWAPYHYGRWFWAAGYGWAWYPGPVYVQPVYRPALVAFFGFGSGGTSFGFGFGNVGWVPLAPYEPFHPWWGPAFVNRTVVYNYNVTNINITNVYRNATVAGGVAVVTHENFANGASYRYVAVHPGDLHSVSVVKGSLPVVPTRQNLSFTKSGPNSRVLAAPLSQRFDRFSPPAKMPPSFDAQRTAIETSARHASLGTEHTRLQPAGSSVWDRFDQNRPATLQGNQVHGRMPENNENSVRHTGSEQADPWSKFRPENNSYTARGMASERRSGNSSARRTKAKPAGSKNRSPGR